MWAGRLNYLLRTLEVACVRVSLSPSFSQPASIRVLNQEGGGEGGGRRGGAGEKQLACEGRAEFLNYLIPVSAPRLKVGVPVFPGDSGNAPVLSRPAQSHLNTRVGCILIGASPSRLPLLSMEWRQIRNRWKVGEGERGRTETLAASDDETPSVSKVARRDDETGTSGNFVLCW